MTYKNGIARSALTVVAALAMFMSLPLPKASAATSIIYVDKDKVTGADDGSTWKNAYLDLQDALAAANSGDQIWVAEGVYKPHTTNQTVSFAVGSGVSVYGGFTGSDSEVVLGQRLPAVNQTILSGAINTAAANDNSNHVVNVAGKTGVRIDGVAIIRGYADAAAPNNDGAGIYAPNATDLVLANLVVTSNIATNNGAGLLISGTASVTIVASRFSSNDAQDDGGAIHMSGAADVDLIHSVFFENEANYGGVVHLSAGSLDVIGSTIADNNAFTEGGAIRKTGGTVMVTNSILWGDTSLTSPEISGSATILHTLIEGGATGTNILDTDPIFLNAAADDYRLAVGSPAREAGLESAIPADLLDVDDDGDTGEPTPDALRATRIQFAEVDMGALETPFACLAFQFLHVDKTATGTGTGANWPNAFTEVRDAFYTARNCPATIEILIAEGRYTPSPFDRALSFDLISDVTITGGYQAGGSSTTNPFYITVLSGDLEDNDLPFPDPALPERQENSLHVVTASAPLTGSFIRTLRISDGQADGGLADSNGGGLLNLGGEVLLRSVVLERNASLGEGAGLFTDNDGPTLGGVELQVSVIRDNYGTRGGGIARAGGNPTIVRDSVIAGNYADAEGGGAYSRGSLAIIGSVVEDNSAPNGGGIYVHNAGLDVVSSEILDNHASIGPGVYVNSGQSKFINTLFAHNSPGLGAAIYVTGTGSPFIYSSTFAKNQGTGTIGIGFPTASASVNNSVVWGNTGSNAGLAGPAGTFTVNYSDVQNWTPAGTVVSVDPLYVDEANDDFRLAPDSPVLDAGLNGSAQADEFDVDGDGDTLEPAPDLDRNKRIRSIQVDMGAYELQPDQITVLPTPCAIYDSTSAAGIGLTGPFAGDETRTVLVSGAVPAGQGVPAGTCVPTGASAVVYTISAIDPLGVGNLRLSEAGVVPNGGVVNYVSNGLNNANTVTVPLGANGKVDITANTSGTGVRLVALGYYSDNPGLDYFPLTPCAVADSRPAEGAVAPFAGLFSGGGSYPDIDVVNGFSTDQGGGNSNCGVPTSAEAVVVNLVAIGVTGGRGYLSATDGGGNPFEPITPFAAIGLNNAAAAIVPLSGQTISIDIDTLTGSPAAHIRVVVLGYLADQDGASYASVNPCAAFDSRPVEGATGGFLGKRVASAATTYDVVGAISASQGGGGGNCGVPTGATAVLINLVAIQADAVGNFRAYASGSTPTGGVLNFSALSPPMNNSNAVVVPVSATGEIDLFVNAPGNAGNPTTHARGIILGYYS